VVDLVHLQQDGLHHVVPDQLKVLAVQQVGDVVLGAGEEVVQADDLRGVCVCVCVCVCVSEVDRGPF
jgi:hypothetical protein